jgi:two-component system response regulator HydG
MQEIYREVGLVAPTNYSIILYGESGTGKEAIAKTIHNLSPRADKPFVTLDCGTLSKELSGSALFGHVKGAFTGAMADKAGHFEIANGGTLFLDEVFNLSYDIQASLLRALQERKVKRIGSTREIDIDIRIIVASNEDLEEAYRRGSFREDLFHRLNEFTISLPPLRERKEDISLFVDYFMEKVKKELNRPDLELGEGLLEALIAYPWPGNIRELKNVIRRISLVATHHKIRVENLPWQHETYSSFPNHPKSDLPNEITEDNGETDLKYKARLAEYNTVMNVLKKVNFNKSQAAVILKIDRKTLYNKLQKFTEDFLHDKEDYTQKT